MAQISLEKAYDLLPKSRRAQYNDSLVEMAGAELRLVKVLLPTSQELLARYPLDDPTYPSRAAGCAQIERSASLLPYAAILGVGDSRKLGLSTAARVKLFDYCQETIPDIVSRLSPLNRKSITDALRLYTDADDPDPLQPRLRMLRLEVESAATTQH